MKGITKLAQALDEQRTSSTEEALRLCASDGSLLGFMKSNRELLKDEQHICLQSPGLAELFMVIGSSVDWCTGKTLNVPEYFKRHNIRLATEVWKLAAYGLLERVGLGEYRLTPLACEFRRGDVNLPKSKWYLNGEIVKEHSLNINFAGVRQKAGW